MLGSSGTGGPFAPDGGTTASAYMSRTELQKHPADFAGEEPSRVRLLARWDPHFSSIS
jgi:hypothetical protein